MNKARAKLLAEIAVVTLIVAGLFGSLSIMELRAEEPRRAIVSMEMLLHQDYVVPKIFGVNYYNKPPLYNWLLAFVFRLSGSFSEVWVRLPCILSLLLTAYLVYRLVKQYNTKQTAFIAAVLLLVSADILFYGAVDAGELDLFFTLLIFLQAVTIFRCSLKQQWWRMFIVSYLLTAAGILTKGLPSIAIQAITLMCWLTCIKQWKRLFSLQHLAGIAIAAIVVAGYFMLYGQKQDAGVYVLRLLAESAERSVVTNSWGSTAINLLQSPLQVLYICFPSSVLLLYAFNKKVRVLVRSDQLFVFSFIFTMIICAIFFIAPETANRYLYPAFPFIAIMGATIYAKAGQVLHLPKWATAYKTMVATFAVLGILRIAYNVWGIPYQLKTLPRNYRDLTTTILHYSQNNPVFLTGYQQRCPVSPFLFIKPGHDTTDDVPSLPYQIPYYITKVTGTVMQYDSLPQKGRFYLTPVDFLKDKKADVFYTFFDDWTRRNIALVKF